MKAFILGIILFSFSSLFADEYKLEEKSISIGNETIYCDSSSTIANLDLALCDKAQNSWMKTSFSLKENVIIIEQYKASTGIVSNQVEIPMGTGCFLQTKR